MADETSASEVEDVSWIDEHVELDLTGNRPAESNGATAGESNAGPSSERGSELASDHWRERAVLWRERAIAAELVAKMLQRNLDDLHASLEDLRREAKAVATAKQLDAATNRTDTVMPPWRRFVRDLTDKYFR